VRDWLETSGFSVQTIQDTNEFHFALKDPIGLTTDIFQVKENQPIVIASARHVANPEQLTAYRNLTEAQQRQFWKMLRLELLRYGVQFTDLTLEGNGVAFSDSFIVDRAFTGPEFLQRVFFVRS
jgi:hypothetical protein